MYGQQRSIGDMPTAVHSDTRCAHPMTVHGAVRASALCCEGAGDQPSPCCRTLVTAFARAASGRGRPITLPPERVDAVDAALRSAGVFNGVADLREAVAGWRRQTRLRADAQGINEYYDSSRSDAYTQRLEGPQTALALRCFELTGLDPLKTPLVLDLGEWRRARSQPSSQL